MKFIPAVILIGFNLAALFLCPSDLYAQAEFEFEISDEHYYIQFNEGEGTPLKDLIILCKDITGYAIQYQEAEMEDQRVFIIGRQKIEKTDKGFFEYFQSVLVSYDFICAPYGPEGSPFFITIKKITPGGAGRGNDLFKAQAPVIPLDRIPEYKDNPGRLITTSIQLKYIDARNTMTSLTPYFPNQQLESLRPVENSNSLIITAFANKVYYITQLIDLMDVEPQEVQSIFAKRELLYAVAEELEPVLTQLVAAARNVRPGAPATKPGIPGVLTEPEPKIIAEPYSNSLLVMASDKMMEKITHWIDVLDVEVDPRGDIHVYRLKNTLAKAMQKVLDDMLRNQQQGGSTRRTPGASGSSVPSTGVEAPAQVVADDISNSLIITASKTKYAELLEVIKKLDIRRRQVLIEAAVVELTSRIDDVLGVELAGIDLKAEDTTDPNYLRAFGFSDFGLSTLEDTNGNGFPDQRIPSVSTGFTGGIFSGDGFAIPFLLYTLSREANANILTMPSILTNDNEEAEIQALDSEPTKSFNTYDTGGTSESFAGYEDAGITLTISPSISAGNYLKLQVKLEVSDFDESSDSNPPPRSERIVSTSVTIPDGHTMIIGGVLTNDETTIENKIPILGDLPLLGWLFRSKAETTRKVNLYVFITPHIIGDDFANLDDISYKKKKEVEALTGDVLLIDPDFEYTNAEKQVIDAGAHWIFEIPSYAEPDTGETTQEYIEPDKDHIRTGEL